MTAPRFYLGTHIPAWLADIGVPLFISRRKLTGRRTFPRAAAPWALDSGGFTELRLHGGWSIDASTYATEVRRFATEVGSMEWAAPQDWMCETDALAATGLTVADHQTRTVANYLDLLDVAADLPWVPVLQGQTAADYLRHVEQYDRAGIDLTTLDRVGLGSVCRRQGTVDVAELVATLDGIDIHGFGVKADGLTRYGWMLASADSLAWSYRGRRIRPCPVRPVSSCANCRHHALDWRAKVLAALDAPPSPTQRVLT